MLIGQCWVADLSRLDRNIETQDLEAAEIPAGTRRLLLKTRNSDLWTTHPHSFVRDFVAATPNAAHWIVERGIKLVGLDYLSIEPFDSPKAEAHDIFLRAGVVPVETLDLRQASEGAYILLCLPIKVADADGAPCRAVLASLPFPGNE